MKFIKDFEGKDFSAYSTFRNRSNPASLDVYEMYDMVDKNKEYGIAKVVSLLNEFYFNAGVKKTRMVVEWEEGMVTVYYRGNNIMFYLKKENHGT